MTYTFVLVYVIFGGPMLGNVGTMAQTGFTLEECRALQHQVEILPPANSDTVILGTYCDPEEQEK